MIAELNAALSAELTAIVQYMTQSEICQNCGYRRLGELAKRRAMEEMKNAEGLIERIIVFDSNPRPMSDLKPQLGSKVQQQIEIDLKDEQDAVRQYNGACEGLCRGKRRWLQGFIRAHDSGRRTPCRLSGSSDPCHQRNGHRQLSGAAVARVRKENPSQ